MDSGRRDLTVVTWNLHGSAGPDLRRVADELRRLAPDVVGLQEVRRSQARRLGEALGWNVSWVFKHYPLTPLVWWRAEGMAIVSPHPLSRPGHLVLTPEVSTSSHRRRVVHWTEVAGPAQGMRVVNVHLSAHREGRAQRAAQAVTVAGRVDSSTVLTGDLNASNEPAVLAPLVAAGLADAWTGPGPGDTNPAGAVRQRLDYVLAGSAFTVSSCTVPEDGPAWAALSDHLPVVARLRIAG